MLRTSDTTCSLPPTIPIKGVLMNDSVTGALSIMYFLSITLESSLLRISSSRSKLWFGLLNETSACI